jgi:hypothetical protein
VLILLASSAQAGGLYVQEFASNSMGTAGAGRGAIHKLSDSTQIGLLFEWLHLGKGKIKSADAAGIPGSGIADSYGPNEVFFLGATINWMTPSWRQTTGKAEG